MRWLVEGHMVNITPVSPGLVLGWREVQVWLRCWPFLKLMGHHETQSNVHSLKFLSAFRTIWWLHCHWFYQWYKLYSWYRHMQSERHNLGPWSWPFSTIIKVYPRLLIVGRKWFFNFYTCNLSSSLNLKTHTDIHMQTLLVLWCWHLSEDLQYDRWTKPTLPHYYTQKHWGIQRKVMFVCVLEWSFVCPSFF